MALVSMQKLRILTTRDRLLQVTAALQSLGVMEISQVKNGQKALKEAQKEEPEDIKTIEFRLAQIEFLEKFLSESLGAACADKDLCLPELESYNLQHYFDWALVDKAQNLRDELLQLEGDRQSLRDERNLLERFAALEIPLKNICDTRLTSVKIGSLPRAKYETFLQKLSKEAPLTHLRETQVTTSQVSLLLIIHSSELTKVDQILSESNFSATELPLRRGTPEEEIERIGRRLTKLDQHEQGIQQEARELAKKNLDTVRVVCDEISNKLTRHREAQKFGQTKSVVIIQGWAPRDHIKEIEKAVLEVAPASAFQKLKIKETDEQPVILHNNKAVEPYESVTTLYGLPLSSEPDPTPWLAAFFVTFFGFCLTDAGYGLSLLIASLAVLYFAGSKLDRGSKLMVKLMAMGGVATTILGVLFGGWFGIDIALMPEWAQHLAVINPLETPLTVLIIALALGAVHLYIGFFIKFIHLLRFGHVKEALMDRLPWLWLLASLGFWLGCSQGAWLPEFASTALYFVYAGLIAVVLGNGFHKSLNPFVALPSGLLALWDLVSFVSDVLSYSRLLALGLATGIIAMVINLIAQIAVDMIGPAGYVVAILILIGGHLFNLAINVLGAFIHSSRLQFVEFFSKFMMGGGKVFAPLCKINKWVAFEK